MKRPTRVTIIGWSYLIISVIVIFLGIANLVFYYKVGSPSLSLEESTLRVTAENSPRYQMIEISRILLASFTIYIAALFLRLQSGSRIALEATSWIILVYSLGINTHRLLAALNFGTKIGNAVPESSMGIYNVVTFVAVFIKFVLVATPILIGIKLLRSQTVKSAFNQQP